MATIRTYISLIGGVIVFFLLGACAVNLKTFTIETATPSSDLLPDKIVSLTLMNRSVTNEFQNYDKDSLQRYFYRKKFDVNAVVLDSMAADTTLKVLADLLFSSGRYDVVIPEDRNFARNLKFYQLSEELDRDEVRRICTEFNTDALLVIERYYNKLITDYTIHPPLFGYEQFATAAIDSKYDAIVKIYEAESGNVVRQVLVSDTISWFESDTATERLFAKLPSVKECLIQTGIRVALDLDAKLSPNWVKENRAYFLLNDDADKVNGFIKNQDWQAAYDYWLAYSNQPKSSIKFRAEYNLALASEMLGSVDEAIEWATKSYYTKYHKQTENYLYRLKKRKEVLQKFQKINN
ncbi:DUF6340 family protein [Gaoshiqia sp. Z1-71]|uniref:DUF6340 family protein n=1 Tax=Gaoshiqia hydrogeniformans TaxID=3290090 RepID=UPI003BF78BAF